MTIKFNCPGCNSKIAFDDSNSGKEMECPECSRKILIPDNSEQNEKQPLQKDKNEAETTEAPPAKPEKVSDESKTSHLDTVNSASKIKRKKDKKKDSQETAYSNPVDKQEREPWSVIDFPKAFSQASNGTALLSAAVFLFIIFISASIFRYIGLTAGRGVIQTAMNAVIILIFLAGFNIALGGLSKLHATHLTGKKKISFADVMGYTATHFPPFLSPGMRIIAPAVLIAGIEIGLFYLCARVEYLYGVIYLPLMIITLILLLVILLAYLITALSVPAVTVDAFRGKGAYEQARKILKKKPGPAMGHALLICIIGLIVFTVTAAVFLGVLAVEQKFFAGRLIGRDAFDYYNRAVSFLIDLEKEDFNSVRESVSTVKGVSFLISFYATLSCFFAYFLSLCSCLHTISYLALTEETDEV